MMFMCLTKLSKDRQAGHAATEGMKILFVPLRKGNKIPDRLTDNYLPTSFLKESDLLFSSTVIPSILKNRVSDLGKAMEIKYSLERNTEREPEARLTGGQDDSYGSDDLL